MGLRVRLWLLSCGYGIKMEFALLMHLVGLLLTFERSPKGDALNPTDLDFSRAST
jgi:hypothetical protein